MRLKKLFKFLLIITVTVTYANALKENEIQEQMTKKIDNVLLILEKKELNISQKGDEIIKILKANNISSALINLGGNVQLLGTKPNGDLWNIGLKSPNSQDYIGILRLADCAIVTSGNYERYFIGEDNKRYWHILDGKTGKPADKHINSVTIVTKQGKLGDALSTALFVMGVDEAINYWKQSKDENDVFEMILIADDKKIYITENLVDSFTLQDKYKDYHMVVVTL